MQSKAPVLIVLNAHYVYTLCQPSGFCLGPVLMELVELSTRSLAEAMFEKLGLPKPVYYVHQLEQGRYRSEVEFHCTKERFHASARWTKLSSCICEHGEASLNHAADKVIGYMETRERNVVVNYYQLQEQKNSHLLFHIDQTSIFPILGYSSKICIVFGLLLLPVWLKVVYGALYKL